MANERKRKRWPILAAVAALLAGVQVASEVGVIPPIVAELLQSAATVAGVTPSESS